VKAGRRCGTRPVFDEFGLDGEDFSVYRQVLTDEVFSRGVASRVLLLGKTRGLGETSGSSSEARNFRVVCRFRRIAVEEAGTGCRFPSG
jgi:hypothetical protein